MNQELLKPVELHHPQLIPQRSDVFFVSQISFSNPVVDRGNTGHPFELELLGDGLGYICVDVTCPG